MVDLPRGVARAYRAVLRKCVPPGMRVPEGPIHCRAGPIGLELSCQQNGILLKHITPGKRPLGRVAFPMSLLPQFEGRDGGSVKLEALGPGKARAAWKERGDERVMEFASPNVADDEVPTGHLSNPGEGFLNALAEATRTAASEQARAALRGVLLRGEVMIATDGRQLLVQGGWFLPWEGEVLVPALPAFGCKELLLEPPLLGKVGPSVILRCGPWLLVMQGQEPRHYPDVDRVMAGTWDSRLILDAGDIEVLRERLPGLPGKEEAFAPVQLDLGRVPRVRAGSEEIVLGRSRCAGPPLSVPSDRRLLLRALALGFREIEVTSGKPLRCRDEKRTYLWMPLDPAVATSPRKQLIGKEEPMPPNGNGPPAGTGQPADALEEAEALRKQLQEALARTARLVASLRQQRREERAVKNAVASLRKLGGLGG